MRIAGPIAVATLAALVAGDAPAQPPPVQAPLPFAVETAVRPVTARIGDPITLTLTLDVPESIDQVRPRLDERLGDFEVSAIDSSAPDRTARGWRQVWRVTLRTFEPGNRVVPTLPLDYTAAGGRLLTVSIDPRATVGVTSPTVTADMPLRPLTARADVPPPSPWPRILLIGGLLSVGVSLIGIPLLRWWARRRARRRRVAFFTELEHELARLAASPGASPADARERYARAAVLLRRGLARIVPGRIETLASTDLAERLRQAGHEPARLATQARISMSAVDAIKFGNSLPPPAQHAATLGEAGSLLQALRRLATADRPATAPAKGPRA
jgi:hypothetical protein